MSFFQDDLFRAGLSRSTLERRRGRSLSTSSIATLQQQHTQHNNDPTFQEMLECLRNKSMATGDPDDDDGMQGLDYVDDDTSDEESNGAIAKFVTIPPDSQLPTPQEHDPIATSTDVPGNGHRTTAAEKNELHLTIKQFDRTIRKSLRYVLRWERMLAFTAVTGSNHFTADAFKFLSKSVATASKGDKKLSTYKTLKSSQWEYMRDNLFAKSLVFYVGRNRNEAHRAPCRKNIQTFNNGEKDIRDCIRTVLPSEWAQLDAQTLPIFNEIFSDKQLSSRISINIESAPLVKDCDRRRYLSGSRSIWASYKKTLLPSSFNELLHFPIGTVGTASCESFLENAIWFTNIGEDLCFKGHVISTWCARTLNSTSRHFPKHDPFDELTVDEKIAYFYTKYATHKPTDFNVTLSSKTNTTTFPSTDDNNSQHEGDRHNCPTNYNRLFIFPGDFCTILRPEGNEESDFVVLFVASQLWRESGRIGERLIWVKKDYLRDRIRYDLAYFKFINSRIGDRHFEEFIQDRDNDATITRTLSKVAATLALTKTVSVTGIPSFPEGSKPKSLTFSSRSTTNKGFLEDGTPYLVYRFFLYMDGFKEKKSLSDQRSVTGCYILPAGLRHQSKASCTCVRTITVAPHGLDTNRVLSYIVDDIVDGTVNGKDTIDAYGRKVKLFLDTPGLLADTPAQSAANDLRGHTANSYCGYCSTKKRKGLQTPPICFTSNDHCRRQSLVRSDERMQEIRATGVHPEVQKHIGTTCATEEESMERISAQLASSLQLNRDKSIVNKDGISTVDFFYDSYQSAAVVPDHMFKGLISNVLNVCFNAMPDDKVRSHVDDLVCHAIRSNHLTNIDTILSWDKHGKYTGINNLKTSSLLCVSLFAAPILKQYGDHCRESGVSTDTCNNATAIAESRNMTTHENSSAIADETEADNHPFDLPTQLQEIISLAYWCPQYTQNLDADIHYVFGKHEKPCGYFGDLQQMASEYIANIRKYYMREGVNASKLDKPNAHRLIEFVHHTIVIYGHALIVSEMVLEQAHRNFKGWLEINTNPGSQITAVELELANDWMRRVHAQYLIWKKGNHNDSKASEHGLFRLLYGAIAHSIPTELYEDALKKLLALLPECLESPVLESLAGQTSTSLLQTKCEHWKLDDKYRKRKTHYFQRGIKLLDRVHFKRITFNSSLYEQFAIAKLYRENECGEQFVTNTFNHIHVGSFVSVKSDEPLADIVVPDREGSSVHYYVVHALGESREKTAFLVVKILVKDLDSSAYKLTSKATLQCVLLNQSVSVLGRISTTHDFSSDALKPQYCLPGLDSKWMVLSNREGFPPRMS